VHAESEGDRLTEKELIATVLLLVIAGHETTANVIGNATYRLLDRPEQRDAIASGDAALVRCAVEELLRLDGPVQMVQRVANERVEVAGAAIEKGQIVVPLVGAANLDPEVFDKPTELQLERSPNPHLAFGAGHHFCIGAPLARLELAVALPALMRLAPNPRLAARPKRRRSFTIRGLETLPLSW
jgi:cytochrome P450